MPSTGTSAKEVSPVSFTAWMTSSWHHLSFFAASRTCQPCWKCVPSCVSPPSVQGRGATPIRLNVKFRADLARWQCFVEDWNGVSFLPTLSSLLDYTVASDASEQWGCGAWFTNLWFQLPWDKATAAYPITVKELLAVASLAFFGFFRMGELLVEAPDQ